MVIAPQKGGEGHARPLSFPPVLRRRPLLAALAAATLLAGCGADSEPGKDKAKASTSTGTQTGTTATTSSTATRPAAPPAKPVCRKVAEPKAKDEPKLKAPTSRLDSDKLYRAVLTTSCGTFTITLDVRRAPKTAASFVSLSEQGFYDNTIFHRIVPGFVIQGGDPLGNGQGGPGYSVVEAPPPELRYTRGVVAMAKTEIEEPGTSGSQFYVVTGPDAQLPPDYALVGRVSAGQDVVDLIGRSPTDSTNPDPARQEAPIKPVVIQRVTIEEARAPK